MSIELIVTARGNYCVEGPDFKEAGIRFKSKWERSPWTGERIEVERAYPLLNFLLLMDFLDLEAGHSLSKINIR